MAVTIMTSVAMLYVVRSQKTTCSTFFIIIQRSINVNKTVTIDAEMITKHVGKLTFMLNVTSLHFYAWC